MTQDTYVAQTIMNQLGGNRFAVMTGAKIVAVTPKSVSFSIGRNSKGCNRVVITLNALDYYDVEFQRVCKQKIHGVTVAENVTVLKRCEDVDCFTLQEVFTRYTGMYTHL